MLMKEFIGKGWRRPMVRQIVRDVVFLARKSQDAGLEDVFVAQDLAETLQAHKEGCVGLASNMIGVSKRIIAFYDGMKIEVMFNPEIIRCEGAYETEEGCLSLDGVRKTKRYKSIKVKYQNEKMQIRMKSYTGWTAQIIQHEIDHCNGIII